MAGSDVAKAMSTPSFHLNHGNRFAYYEAKKH